MFKKQKARLYTEPSPTHVDASLVSRKPSPRKRLPGPSVKQIVRSLSGRYSAPASPLKNEKNGCKASHGSEVISQQMDRDKLQEINPSIVKDQEKAPINVPAEVAVCKKSSPTFCPSQQFLALAHFTPGSADPRKASGLRTQPRMAMKERNTSVKKSEPTTLQRQVGNKVPAKAFPHLENCSQQNQAINNRQARQLSQVLKSEQKLVDQNKQYELELQELQDLFTNKDEEVESVRYAGYMLKQLCMKQEEEIQTLKSAFPATIKEIAQLRELCQRQERELAEARVAIPSFQQQLTALTEQFKFLVEDVAQVKAASSATLESYKQKSLEAAESGVTNNSCSNSTVTSEEYQTSPESPKFTGKHRKGLSLASLEEKLQSGDSRFGKPYPTDKELMQTLEELNHVAAEEHTVLQERCTNAFKDLRSSSSRFASLESLKSMLICNSPFNRNAFENKKSEISRRIEKVGVNAWNLKPT